MAAKAGPVDTVTLFLFCLSAPVGQCSFSASNHGRSGHFLLGSQKIPLRLFKLSGLCFFVLDGNPGVSGVLGPVTQRPFAWLSGQSLSDVDVGGRFRIMATQGINRRQLLLRLERRP